MSEQPIAEFQKRGEVMSETIKNDTEAFAAALRVIAAQDALLVAYRMGRLRAPEKVMNTLSAQRHRLTEYLTPNPEEATQ